MAIRINTNVMSQIAQRNLGRATLGLVQNVERLSSGLRINHASDDPTGMTIASRMSARIRGLGQATRNANDGISVAQTAEGALEEATNLVIRIRELAVQAANDTNTDDDRASIQSEVDDLVSEVTRIAQDTEFNGTAILDGTFIGKEIHVGANSAQSVALSFGDARSTRVGRQARPDGVTITTTPTNFDDFQLNTFSIRGTADTDDTLSSTKNLGSSIAKAQAINDSTTFTGVRAIVNATTVSGDFVAQGGDLDTTDFIVVNGETINGFTVQAADADGALVDAINSVSSSTGIIATRNSDSILAFETKDGRNIAIQTSTAASAQISGLNNNAANLVVTGGSITLQSEENITLVVNVAAAAGAIGFGVGAGTFLFGVDETNALNTIDVSTSTGADRAIDIADVALEQITSLRSKIGATQNRLESTVANLQTEGENLSAAHSRIVDVDFAAEAASLAKNSILQSAGVSVLAQANIRPELALNLLAS